MSETLFHRSVVFATVPIRGYFLLAEKFQLFFDSTLSRPVAYDAHHPLVLEHYYDVPPDLFKKTIEKNSLSIQESFLLGHYQNAAFNSILNLLSVFTPYHFFAYDKKNKNQIQAWFSTLSYQKENQEFLPDYSTTWGTKIYNDLPNDSFNSLNFSQHNNNPIPFATRDRISVQRIHAIPSFPEDINILFHHYFTIDKAAKESFDNSCILFKNGIELFDISFSLSFFAFVACIETLIHFTNKKTKIENCISCGQPVYKVTKKFKEFLKEYGSNDTHFKETADKFYQMRSKIAHQGGLMVGDTVFSITQSHLDELQILRELKSLSGICMRNWLLAQPPVL